MHISGVGGGRGGQIRGLKNLCLISPKTSVVIDHALSTLGVFFMAGLLWLVIFHYVLQFLWIYMDQQ